jgi:hypothetical protein
MDEESPMVFPEADDDRGAVLMLLTYSIVVLSFAVLVRFSPRLIDLIRNNKRSREQKVLVQRLDWESSSMRRARKPDNFLMKIWRG